MDGIAYKFLKCEFESYKAGLNGEGCVPLIYITLVISLVDVRLNHHHKTTIKAIFKEGATKGSPQLRQLSNKSDNIIAYDN